MTCRGCGAARTSASPDLIGGADVALEHVVVPVSLHSCYLFEDLLTLSSGVAPQCFDLLSQLVAAACLLVSGHTSEEDGPPETMSRRGRHDQPLISSAGSTTSTSASLRMVSGQTPPLPFSSFEMTSRCTPLSPAESPINQSRRLRSCRSFCPPRDPAHRKACTLYVDKRSLARYGHHSRTEPNDEHPCVC